MPRASASCHSRHSAAIRLSEAPMLTRASPGLSTGWSSAAGARILLKTSSTAVASPTVDSAGARQTRPRVSGFTESRRRLRGAALATEGEPLMRATKLLCCQHAHLVVLVERLASHPERRIAGILDLVEELTAHVAIESYF